MVYDSDVLEGWFNEAVDHPNTARVDGLESVALIYKGFKIELTNDEGSFIFDVRFRDLYSPVSKKNLNILKQHGFILGADLIMYRRGQDLIKRQKRILSRMATNRKHLLNKGRKGDLRRARGIINKEEQALKDYHMYVSRGQDLQNKLEKKGLI